MTAIVWMVDVTSIDNNARPYQATMTSWILWLPWLFSQAPFVSAHFLLLREEGRHSDGGRYSDGGRW